MDMAVSVPDVAEEVEVSSLSVLPVEAAVPGPHLYGEAVTGNVHLVSALERDESLLGPALRCILAAKAPGTVRKYSFGLEYFYDFSLGVFSSLLFSRILYVSTRILPLILFVLFYILVLFIYPVLFTLSFIVLQSHILVLFVLCVYFRSFNLSSYCTNPLHIHFCYNFSCRFCSGTMASAFASAVFPRDY